jgi:ABC-type polysaccharide/polyol phosphate export permease
MGGFRARSVWSESHEGHAVSSPLGRLVAKRDLLYMLTWREIRIKYKQSVMGMLWAILMPAVIVSAGVVVRAGFSMLSGRHLEAADVASVSVRAVPWAFFVSSIRFATSSLIANSSLVTKVYLPREVFPVASMLSQLMDFAVAALVLVVVLTVLHVGVSVQLLWLPGLIIILVAMTTGLCIVLSAASLFLRDVKYLVEVVLTFAIFFTPVFYEARMFGRWAPALMLNPVAPVLEGIADTVVRHTSPSLPWVGYSALCALGIFVGALAFFHRLEPYFAESA